MNRPQPTDFNSPEILDELACNVLEWTALPDIDGAEVSITAGEGLAVTVRGGACEMVEHERDKSLAITLFSKGRKGSATTSDFSSTALRESIAAAREIALHGEADAWAGLAAPDWLARENPELELDHPWALEAEAAIALALECERAALGHDSRIKQSDGASVNRYRGTRAYANTHGFHGAYRGTRHGISAVMIATDKHGMQRGYWYSSSRDSAALENAASIGQTAARRTVAKLGAHRIQTTELPVIYEARAAAGLIGHLISAISGGAQYRRASFLLDAIGTRVLPDFISLTEQPHLPGALGSAPFDGDGVATRTKTIVGDGVLETYLLSAYAARRLGRAPTGNAGGTHNLVLTPGTRSLPAMIAAERRALLVTDLMGFGVNGVTGDYSRGASGFLIEHGEIVHAVEEITIAGNLKDMLHGITEVGADVELQAAVRTGSVRIGCMAVAGA